MSDKASSIVLYCVAAFISVVGVIALVNKTELTWHYLLLWALAVIFCIIDAVSKHQKG